MYIMYTYSSILFISIVILLAYYIYWFNKPNTNIVIVDKKICEPLDVQYPTINNIDYAEIDRRIDKIQNELDRMKNIYNNIKFDIGDVVTTTDPLDPPKIRIGGDLSKILLHFTLAPPEPGNQGEPGEVGPIGANGLKGNTGIRGSIGGNGLDRM